MCNLNVCMYTWQRAYVQISQGIIIIQMATANYVEFFGEC